MPDFAPDTVSRFLASEDELLVMDRIMEQARRGWPAVNQATEELRLAIARTRAEERRGKTYIRTTRAGVKALEE